MTIHLSCPDCGAKLKVKDELAGRQGKCPKCKTRVTIPAAEPQTPKEQPQTPKEQPQAAKEADAPDSDKLFEDEFASAPTVQDKASAVGSSGDDPIPFDSLTDDDEPAPQIILAGGEKPGGSAEAKPKEPQPEKKSHKPTHGGERIFDPDEVPHALGKLNRYLICDHKDVVARWESDDRGWMIHLKDGFTRAKTVENQIPQFGNFVLVEVGVERRDDGLHLKNITSYQLRRQYALTKIAKGDDAVLETVIDYAELNDRQRAHVRELVKSKFLPHMWAEMDALLD